MAIMMGEGCSIERGAIIRPPFKTNKGQFNYYPMKIGNQVRIGSGSLVESASLGNGVSIGRDCIIVSLWLDIQSID